MRAIFINEIRQGVETSGLGPLGIGKAAMTKGYDYAVSHWPSRINIARPVKETFELIEGIPHNPIIQKCYINFFQSLERRFNINFDDFKWVSRAKRSVNPEGFEHWADWLTQNRTKATVNAKSFQYIAYFGYSSEYSLGYCNLKPYLNGMNTTAHNGYFLRYK